MAKQEKKVKKDRKIRFSQGFLEILARNEIDANHQMVRVCLVGAAILLLVWILYLTRFFYLDNLLLVNIFFPICIVFLVSPFIWERFIRGSKPGFKYFVLIGFLAVVATLNVIIPKHAMIGYAAVVVLTNHYYSRRTSIIITVISLVTMLLCLYLAMFVGEYDPNLLGMGVPLINEAGEAYIYHPDGVAERFNMLHDMLVAGENRYLKVFLYYFVPRSFIITMVFVICDGLNYRTFRLLESEAARREEKKAVETELSIASSIQRSALPDPFQSTDDVEIVSSLFPAKEVGGDLYYHFKLSDRKVGIVIGDVSGKGTPAAMFMMKAVGVFRFLMSAEKTPAKIMKEVNYALCQHNSDMMFVTAFLAILDLDTGVLQYCNAGHNKPLLGSKKNFQYLPCKPGFILGGDTDAVFFDEKTTMKPGDVLLLYTDGMTEARNPKGEFFGEESLQNLANSIDFSSMLEFHYEIEQGMRRFEDGAPQADDITHVVLQYRGDKVISKELTVPAELESTQQVLDFVKDAANEFGVPDSITTNLLVCTDELFSNIAKYAFPEGTGDAYLRMQFNAHRNELRLVFVDHGIPFDPFQWNAETVSEDNYKNRKEGGLGVLLVKNFADDLRYSRLGDINVLSLIKYISK